MFFEKNIVVSIGYNGVIVALHTATKITNKIFFKEFNEENAKQLNLFFEKHKRAKLYVLLDSIDQTYKKKFYPSVRKMDLPNLVRRDLGGDSNKESLRGYILQNSTLDENKTKKWETLLINISINEEIAKWLDFLILLPNLLVGIYAIPIESFTIIKKLNQGIKKEKALKLKEQQKLEKKKFFSPKKAKNKKVDKTEKLHAYCLILFCKISGYRQVVFSDHGTIFTRLVSYDVTREDFISSYEQDIYSTYEYLKRSFTNIEISDISIINIVSQEIIDKLDKLTNDSFLIQNLTPFEASKKLGIKRTISSDNSYCDLLLSRLFVKSKKILQFKTPKITSTKRFFSLYKLSYYFNLFLIIFFFVEILANIDLRIQYEKQFDDLEVEKFKVYEELNRMQNNVLNIEGDQADQAFVDIEKSIESGKIDEALAKKNEQLFNEINNISFVKKHNLILDRISYSQQGYNSLSPNAKTNYTMLLYGKMINVSGNIDDLFKEFDDLTNEGDLIFKNNKVIYSKLPRDIDFNKKYYDFPINFTISSK